LQTGTKISGALHVGALGLAIFGGALFRADTTEAIQVANVSVITSEDFAALQSSAPDPSPEIATAPEIMEPEPAEPVEEAVPEIVQPAEPVEATPEPEEQLAMVAPERTPAPRIDTQSAPKPDPSAQEAETTVKEAVPDEAATETAEPLKEQAPKEAATEIVTEADKPSEFAPTTSDVPRSRPRDMKERVAELTASEPVEEPAAEEPVDNTADEIAKALAEAQAEVANNKPAVPQGPPLTGGERDGLVLAVQKCWNVPVGLQNADDLAVVIAVELTPDGKLASSPKLIDPAGAPSGTTKQAFEAGRRALIRCAPYDLPSEKYEQWRQIEVVFNPEKMVVK
jgi:hypothetical protein